MVIGIPKEIKNNEERISLTPDGAKLLKKAGHTILVQAKASSHFSDSDYKKSGAKIIKDAPSIWKQADVIVKVKEPVKQELTYLKYLKNKTLFTYLHLSGVDIALTKALIKYNVTGIAYETIEDKKGRLPLLAPMSEVAAIIGVQEGAHYLMRSFGGRGVTLGSITGVASAHVVVVGGGVSGTKSAQTALGMGSGVTILEKNKERLSYLKKKFPKINVLESNQKNLNKFTRDADLLIGAVLIKGAAAPKIITRKMIAAMKTGSVIVDIAIDQGGCTELSHATTHSDPIFYSKNGVILYCVANMPGQASLQSTLALTAATLPYLLKITKKGPEAALKKDKGLLQGLNTYQGNITYKQVAQDLNMLKSYQKVDFS